MTDFINPLDPLKNFQDGNQRELFVTLRNACHGRSLNEVVGAAINLVVNALRQECHQLRDVEQRWDEVVGRAKGLLLEHYDTSRGVRKDGVFPFDQTVQMPHHIDPDKIFKQ